MKKLLGGVRRIAQLQKGSLKRVLRVSDLFAIGFGDVGSSIYYALGVTALYAMGATPIALGLAGLVFVCTSLTYAELTSAFHESGGTASFARRVFNDFISFIAGWGLLFDYVITIAISAFAVAPYLGYFIPQFQGATPHATLFSIFLILVLLAINIFGVRQSTRMSLFLVMITIITQLSVIFIGLFWLLDLNTVLDHTRINVPNVNWSPTWPEFFKGTAMAMVAYTGIESIAQLGAEAKKPSKTVPRAVMITMAVLVLLYIGISFVALSAVSAHELGTTYVNDPIAGIVAHLPIGGKVLGAWVGLFAGVLLFVASNAGLVGASRLSFNMGEYYQLPRFFYRLHLHYRTPHFALAFFAAVAIIVILAAKGRMAFLADLYNFGAMLAFFFAHLSLLVLRFKRPELKRPFRVPLNIPWGKYSIPIPAVIGCLATMSVWFLVVITKPEGRYFGFAWMILGISMYLYYRRKQKIRALGSLEIHRVRLPRYTPVDFKHILVPIWKGTQMSTIQMACELANLHNAKITFVHIIEVPFSVTLDAFLPQRTLVSEAMLEKAEAIGREYNIGVAQFSIRARSLVDAILDLLHKSHYDLVVLGSMATQAQSRFGTIVEKILKKAPCRVWVCCGEQGEKLLPE